MDQVMSERIGGEPLERIASACQTGLILVDASGRIVWIDEATARRVNGGLQHLALPLSRPDGPALDCFLAPVDVMINGERLTICAIQEVCDRDDSHGLIAAFEAVMADSASWLTRSVIERLASLRHAKRPAGGAAGLAEFHQLSDREREVLGLICEGCSDGRMSELLGLSENTVRNHIAALYRKIGVNRRTAAIIWARERGITSRDLLGAVRRKHRPPVRAENPPGQGERNPPH